MSDKWVRVFSEDGTTLLDLHVDGELSGVIPAIGDIIVNPGVPVGKDRRRPQNREFWEVVRRYLSPQEDSRYAASLVVKSRAGRDDEWEFFNN